MVLHECTKVINNIFVYFDQFNDWADREGGREKERENMGKEYSLHNWWTISSVHHS